MVIKSNVELAAVLEFINANEILAYDTETTGLNVRQDRVIGFSVSNGTTGFYIPLYRWDAASQSLLSTGLDCKPVLEALKTKKLLTWNASFDMRITANNLGVDLLPALHADVLLLKHTCDEDFPFGLKEVGAKIYGQDVKKEKEEMQASIKANGGTSREFFKADTQTLGQYAIQDGLLTYRLFNHYEREIQRHGLAQFYYQDEVLPLYKNVTIPMESTGVALDMDLLETSMAEIVHDLRTLELSIQWSIGPLLKGVFLPWLLNKDYPLKTFTGKQPAWSKKYSSQLEAFQAENQGKYMFNLLSKHHLKKLFFDTLKEEPLSRTPTGLPQVDEEFLATMAPKYPWAAQLIEYNKLTKIKGTYIQRFLEEHENGIFYPSFMQHRTVSGRYGSDLQQLPRPSEAGSIVAKHNNRIRAFIKARPGHKLISADYSQLEPRCFAHTSGDAGLQAIFRQPGLDFYTAIAQQTAGLQEVSKAQRQKAKAYALGIAYGMTGYKLKFEIDTGQETADALVKGYLTAFPDLASWMEKSKQQAMHSGTVQSQAGRKRRLKQAQALYRKYGDAITDDLQLWKQYNKNPKLYEKAKADRRVFKNECNNAINFQVQSLAASIVNRAALKINTMLAAASMSTRIVMQVHDELVYEAPEAEVQQACNIIKQGMETVLVLNVPLIATPVVGSNFSECK